MGNWLSMNSLAQATDPRGELWHCDDIVINHDLFEFEMRYVYADDAWTMGGELITENKTGYINDIETMVQRKHIITISGPMEFPTNAYFDVIGSYMLELSMRTMRARLTYRADDDVGAIDNIHWELNSL